MAITDNDILGDIQRNRYQAEHTKHINFDVSRIQVQLLHDVDITGEAGETAVGQDKQIKYAKNAEELIEELTKYCAALISRKGFEKVSTVTLRGYAVQMMEDLFGVFENDAPKILLAQTNRAKFSEVIEQALDNYKNKIDDKKKEAKKRSFKQYRWEVPERREYSEESNVAVPQVKAHALMPFMQLKKASNPEKRFEAFLESNREYIDWWYKNGDEGKQHYSIAYDCADGSKSLFYVDFVIRMKNGTICLFDTKSCGSDSEAPNKHNALVDYMNEAKENGNAHIIGGVIIEDGDNWKYCSMHIENTDDLTGWDAFHPDMYGE